MAMIMKCTSLSPRLSRARRAVLSRRRLRSGAAIVLLSMVFLAAGAPAAHARDAAAAPQSDSPGGTRTLWQIGKFDRDTAGLALGRDGWEKFAAEFPSDPLFIIGRSDEARDWPYVHPGPSDAWAGSRQHTFTIYFNLAGQPREGRCTLHIELADTHDCVPPKMRIDVNGRSFGFHETPAGGPDETLYGDPSLGRPHVMDVGFPADALRPGLNEITVTNLFGSWVLYDALRLEGPAAAAVEPGPATMAQSFEFPALLVRKDGELQRQVRISVIHHGGGDDRAVIRLNGDAIGEARLDRGMNLLEAAFLASDQPEEVTVSVETGSDGGTGEEADEVGRHEEVLAPVRHWIVYFVHHTHLDIGYTHVQDEVLALQIEHLANAAAEGRRTADYPGGSRFKWNPEGLWAVDAIMQNGPEESRDELLAAIRSGTVALDALYGNVLTGLCRPEELFELAAFGQWMAGETVAVIDSAMISDVPGCTWGLVPALAQCGVKYLSMGPNSGHRIGHTLSAWGDRPFYWVSPSGREQVLCWMAGKGYSWFHGAWRGADTFNYAGLKSRIDPARILAYLDQLDADSYPYDMVQVRYNIGSDNGPPDPELCDFVRDWNARFAHPRMVIASTSEMFHDFEERYRDAIPAVQGDFTPYWEDGAASSAAETALCREAAERLVQAAVIQSLLDPAGYRAESYRQAWRQIFLYNEHTWGSWNSISDPECDFTKQQWAIKQSFARKAHDLSSQLLDDATAPVRGEGEIEAVLVLNTASWPRTDLAILPEKWASALPPDLTVTGPRGEAVLSQRLASGELAFLARDVPPLGYALYWIESGAATQDAGMSAASVRATKESTDISNGLLSATIDPVTGAVSALKRRGIPYNLVDQAAGPGLNDFIHVSGRDPANQNRPALPRITVRDAGPLVATVAIESDAPGCGFLEREVRMVAGRDHVELATRFDKLKDYEKEAVHLSFPFGIEEGVVRVDTGWAVVRPDADQLAGACRNHFCAQRFVDVSNQDFGVTWTTRDAPLVEIGGALADPIVAGWRKSLKPSPRIYSYVMNNYWETNYRASQEGHAEFRYAIRPHGRYDAGEAARFGIERSQELIVVPAGPVDPPEQSFFELSTNDVVATSIKPSADGEALMIRLFNAGGRPATAAIVWRDAPPKKTWLSSPLEGRDAPLEGGVAMLPWDIVTLRADL